MLEFSNKDFEAAIIKNKMLQHGISNTVETNLKNEKPQQRNRNYKEPNKNFRTEKCHNQKNKKKPSTG